MRPGLLALIALLCACFGAASALAVARGAGWLGAAGTETVVVPSAGDARAVAAPAVARSIAKPLAGNGFAPSRIYSERSPGVVTIYAFFGDAAAGGQASQGSGFVATDDGYILTSSHVITNAGEGSKTSAANHVYVEFADNDRVPARVVGWDVFDDVGVLKVDAKDHAAQSVPLGDSDAVVVGEPVAAIGSPFGKVDSLAVGVVSAVHRSIESLTSSYVIADAIQTDAPINHGNSGGPLFDARGRAIGINAQIRSESGNGEGVGFAVPIDAAKRSMAQLIAHGRVEYSYLGIETQDLTPSAARHFGFGTDRGAVVVSVHAGSPAARAGLRGSSEQVFFNGDAGVPRDGDVIVAIDGRTVTRADDVIRIVSERLVPGQRARLTIYRGSKRRQVEVLLARRPGNTPA